MQLVARDNDGMIVEFGEVEAIFLDDRGLAPSKGVRPLGLYSGTCIYIRLNIG